MNPDSQPTQTPEIQEPEVTTPAQPPESPSTPRSLNFLIGILVGMILLTGGYCIYLKFFSTPSTEPNESTEEAIENTLTSEDQESNTNDSSITPSEVTCNSDETPYNQTAEFTFCYPSTWTIRIGNVHDPTLPADTIVVAAASNTADINIIHDNTDLSTPIEDAVISFIERTTGPFGPYDTESVTIGGETGSEIRYSYEGAPDIETNYIYAGIRHSNVNFFIKTGYAVSLMNGQTVENGQDRIHAYERILETFVFED